MPLPLDFVRKLAASDPKSAWEQIFAYALERFDALSPGPDLARSIARADEELADVDLFVASAAWDLWSEFRENSRSTAAAVTEWWDTHSAGRAILVIDAMSLRELPWIIQGAKARGLVNSYSVTAAELPPETNKFAHALGFPNRSALANNGGRSKKLQGAYTDTSSMPWEQALSVIASHKDLVYWYSGFDDSIHRLAEGGNAAAQIIADAQRQLTSDSFWNFVIALCKGRHLLITSDHGYAISGAFHDIRDDLHAKQIKEEFKGQRYSQNAALISALPPLTVKISTADGPTSFVLGRKKWKVAGGFPRLSHGGLSILEVAVPFIQLPPL